MGNKLYPRGQNGVLQAADAIKEPIKPFLQTGIKRQQIHSIQTNKAIFQQNKDSNPNAPVIKQGNLTPIKTVSEEQSIVSPNGTNESYAPQQTGQRHIEESKLLQKMMRYWKNLIHF